MSKIILNASGISKRFCRDLRLSLKYASNDALKTMFKSFLPRTKGARLDPQNLRSGEFWALRDVSFSLREGECLGLIGSNGAGKSTLLRILNNLIRPDTGSATVHGSVGALIALGAGFNPLLSGRENIYIAASILGMKTRDIDRVLPTIVEFSELESFIDSPVQTYSSGMQARLGFSIAINMNHDILLIDEILSVGDVRFREKCYQMLSKLRENGTSFIFVSHSSLAINLMCDTCLFLKGGRVEYLGNTDKALQLYSSEGIERSPKSELHDDRLVLWSRPPLTQKINYDHPVITTVARDSQHIQYGFPLALSIDIDLPIGVTVVNKSWQVTLIIDPQHSERTGYSWCLDDFDCFHTGFDHVRLAWSSDCLILEPGRYTLKVFITNDKTKAILSTTDRISLEVLSSGNLLTNSMVELVYQRTSFKMSF